MGNSIKVLEDLIRKEKVLFIISNIIFSFYANKSCLRAQMIECSNYHKKSSQYCELFEVSKIYANVLFDGILFYWFMSAGGL